MAERIQVELVDDIDGSRAEHTVTFALDGVTYEIDLNDQHARQLRSALAPYIERASPAKQTSSTPRQQEREERRVRRSNRQLTEQIRGAARRSHELHKQELERDRVGVQPEQEGHQQEQSEQDRRNWLGDVAAPMPSAAAESASEETSDSGDEMDPARVPAVSLPRFSSAGD